MPILGTSPATYPAGVYNVKDYGAVGDFSADDTTAIATAMNALRANSNAVTGNMGGQTLYFPAGYYKVSSSLDWKLLADVRVFGVSGRAGQGYTPASNESTVIAFTGSTSSPAVDMRGSQSCTWDGVSLVSRNSGHTGQLLSFDTHPSGAGTGHADIFGMRLQNCTLTSVEGNPSVLLGLAANIETSCDNVTFGAMASTGSQVRMVDTTAPYHWSNANSFRSCSFTGTRANSILNPGPQVSLYDCTFEPTTGGVAAPIRWDTLGNENATAFSCTGCGFWDNTAATGSWFLSSVVTSAFSFMGCKMSAGSSAPIFDLSSHSGLALIGCEFDGTNGGTPNLFKAGQNITNGSMVGCYVRSPVVDNHTSVFV